MLPRRSLASVALAVLLAGCGSGTVDHGAGHDAMHGDEPAAHDDAHDDLHDDRHDAMHGDHDDAPPIEGAREVEVEADALAFDPASLELVVGEPVNIVLTSSDVFHDLVVDEVGFHLGAEAGQTVTGGLVVDEPGTYLAYCSVPGHRSAGMELELVVD